MTNRWMDWQDSPHSNEKSRAEAPTKPTKAPSVGFVGSSQAQTRFEEVDAVALLNRLGVRLAVIGGGFVIGVWEDLDSPAVRDALTVLGLDRLPVHRLDGHIFPLRYKVRAVTG